MASGWARGAGHGRVEAVSQSAPPDLVTAGWTIYDVLRRLVECARWTNDEERFAATRLVDELEQRNALGTQAATTTIEREEA